MKTDLGALEAKIMEEVDNLLIDEGSILERSDKAGVLGIRLPWYSCSTKKVTSKTRRLFSMYMQFFSLTYVPHGDELTSPPRVPRYRDLGNGKGYP